MTDLNQFFDEVAVTLNKLVEQNKCLRKERDALVEDIRMLGRMGQDICTVCAHYNHGEGVKEKCISCIMKWDTDNFEWRGMKEG